MNDTHDHSAIRMVRRQDLFPDGHFYSPIVDIDDVTNRCHAIWPVNPVAGGIDFNDASHRKFLTVDFPRFMPEFDYPENVKLTLTTVLIQARAVLAWLRHLQQGGHDLAEVLALTCNDFSII